MKLWIARDEYGELTLHHNKPEYVYDEHYRMSSWVYGGCIGEIYEKLFPEITFENSPQEVELKLVSEIVGVAESPLKTFPRVNEFEVGASYRR